jgi:hypothetical protein
VAGSDVVVGGDFLERLDLGDLSADSRGAEDLFLARFDSAGRPRWLRTFGDFYHDDFRALAVSDAGTLVFAGMAANLAGGISLGGPKVPAQPGVGGFVTEFDGEGRHLRTRELGGGFFELDCAVDRDGRVLVARGAGSSLQAAQLPR